MAIFSLRNVLAAGLSATALFVVPGLATAAEPPAAPVTELAVPGIETIDVSPAGAVTPAPSTGSSATWLDPMTILLTSGSSRSFTP